MLAYLALHPGQAIQCINPNYRISDWYQVHVDYKDQATVEELAGFLRQAGLPE